MRIAKTARDVVYSLCKLIMWCRVGHICENKIITVNCKKFHSKIGSVTII